ncbi:MAG: glycosyltransferase family 2 protein [Lachnospiraceae bacterium]|nr:glycosyltransferase family 2 protein [Lachnospiraceae bacterium]
MVSVIVPSYNSGNYVIHAVSSALLQDVEKEIIVIDDCSKDSSIDFFVQQYATDFVPRNEIVPKELHKENCEVVLYWQGKVDDTLVSVYKNKANQGVAVTRNIGVNLAKGEYIALLDSDDWWVENKLKRQIVAMEETGAVMCNTARELVRHDGRPVGHIIHTPEVITIKDLKKTNYINCSSVLVKREALLKYPMEHDDAHEDYLAWLQIVKDYGDVVGIDEPLMKYRLSIGGKSRNKFKAAKMTYRTYCYAGFGKVKSAFMMFAYTYNGLKKYK